VAIQVKVGWLIHSYLTGDLRNEFTSDIPPNSFGEVQSPINLLPALVTQNLSGEDHFTFALPKERFPMQLGIEVRAADQTTYSLRMELASNLEYTVTEPRP
jgi:hypothetical protein